MNNNNKTRKDTQVQVQLFPTISPCSGNYKRENINFPPKVKLNEKPEPEPSGTRGYFATKFAGELHGQR